MNHQQNLEDLRHSAAHLLASAVLKLYPDTKPAIGPSIDTGFYYDFDFVEPISDADLTKIEKTMHQIIGEWQTFEMQKVSPDEAKQTFPNNQYKQELIDEFVSESKDITLYKSGNFIDLCRGGHVENPSQSLKHFKLLSLAGAYWRGDEKNKMLTRIYGTAFFTKEELDTHLHNLEEAKKRDHKKIGPALGLYIISEDIGKGLPLLTPKGTIIRNEIIAYERELEKAAGFQEVWTPHIAKNDLYKRTGHWDHYQDVMYAPFGIDNETYVLKPMNCPHHYMIYESQPRSYKDLPYRVCEPGTCYRYEKSGELGGLTRVRALTIDDSHILMTESQIDSEFSTCITMVKQMLAAFGLTNYYVRLSLNDPDDNVKYIADSQTWKQAGEKLEHIVKNNHLEYTKGTGEASFYGPKIDFMVKDAIGREWQMSTLQLDLFMAKRLGLVYTDSDGKEKNPVILHRGLTGSLERTIGLLIEHFAGAFPVWLHPVQAVIIPIGENHLDAANSLKAKLDEEGIRVEIWSDESLSKRIRLSEQQKVPYIIVIGDKEIENHQISVRARGKVDLGSMEIQAFIDRIKQKIHSKALDL